MNKTKHIPVLKAEINELINPELVNVYVDLTLGGGGHFLSLLNRIDDDKPRILVGVDQDQAAIERMKERLEGKLGLKFQDNGVLKTTIDQTQIILINSNFENLADILEKLEISDVSTILVDLGTSQDQIEDEERGFSFMKEAPLDMRMSEGLAVKASDLINGLTKSELVKLFNKLSDFSLNQARKLANAIVERRKQSPIQTTFELKRIINQVMLSKRIGSRQGKHRNYEARVFQALRIAVNHELHALQQLLPQAFEALEAGGRLIVISFHSGEDRIVKHYFKNISKEGKARFIEKLLKPTPGEIAQNPRSSSSKLRAIEKLV